MARLILKDLNLDEAVRRMCSDALRTAGSIAGAASLLKITRYALMRRIVKLNIDEAEAGRSPQRRPLVPGPALQEVLDGFSQTLSGRELELFRSRIFGAVRPPTLQELERRWSMTCEGVKELEMRLLRRLGKFLLGEINPAP